MFSTAQQEYIDSFVPTMLEQGYKSYLVYTHTNTQSGYNVLAQPDLIFIFSTEDITATNSYQYVLDGESVKYEIRTANYSLSSNAVNTERIEGTSVSGNINIPIYEHIYSNAQYSGLSIQPDIMKGGEQYNAVQSQTGNVILCAFLLVFCFMQMWKISK